MKKLALLLLIPMALSFASSVKAEEKTSKEDLVAFVKMAADYARQNGKEKALAEFMNKDGIFFKGELYIFAYDFSGTVISHGAKPSLVGKNLMLLRDANGLAVIEELVKVAKTGDGFLKYYWDNPQVGKVMPKLGYVIKIDDDWWLGSGIYEQ